MPLPTRVQVLTAQPSLPRKNSPAPPKPALRKNVWLTQVAPQAQAQHVKNLPLTKSLLVQPKTAISRNAWPTKRELQSPWLMQNPLKPSPWLLLPNQWPPLQARRSKPAAEPVIPSMASPQHYGLAILLSGLNSGFCNTASVGRIAKTVLQEIYPQANP